MGIFNYFSGPPNIENLKQSRDVQGLLKALRYKKDPLVRQAAAFALGELKEAHAFSALLDALSDQQWIVCAAAAQSLGDLGDTRAVEQLIRMLSHPHYLVVEKAAIALGIIGDERAIIPLSALLSYAGSSSVVHSLESSGIPIPASARSQKQDLEARDVRKAAQDALRSIRKTKKK